jgi:prepilin-type N-terminal cleavage/methylation domain-containing protein
MERPGNKRMSKMISRKKSHQGFTLIELVVAMVISLVVMGAIYGTFKSQEDSFVIQDQVAAMQQNLRGAMYVMTRDIQMAGFITNFDTKTYTNVDWDPTLAGNEAIRPLIYGRNNDNGSGIDVKPGTDVIVIAEASNDPSDSRQLGATDTVTPTTLTLDTSIAHTPNLDDTVFKFGVLVKNDLSRAEVFQVQSKAGNVLTFQNALQENYDTGDRVYLAHVIIYKVNINDPLHPSLQREDLGNDQGFQTVAEDIDNLQLRYLLANGTTVDNPAQWTDVRAVQVSLLARTDHINRGYTNTNTYTMADQAITPNDGYRRKLMTSLIKTRNIGL